MKLHLLKTPKPHPANSGMTRFIKSRMAIFSFVLFFALLSTATLRASCGNPKSIQSVKAGNYNTGSTWSGGVVPDICDYVIISHAVVLNVDINTGQNGTGGLTINSGGSLIGSRNITVQGGNNYTVTNNGTLSITGLNLYSGTPGGRFVNYGTATISSSVTFDGGSIIMNGGTLTINTNVTFVNSYIKNFENSTFTVSGNVNLQSTTTFDNYGKFNANGTNSTQAFYLVTGYFYNHEAATLKVPNGGFYLAGPSTNIVYNDGVIKANNFDTHDDAYFENTDSLVITLDYHNNARFLNTKGAYVKVGRDFYNDTKTPTLITNNGGLFDITRDFINNRTITGAVGGFKIGGVSTNNVNGIISGTLDFCDPSASGAVDNNLAGSSAIAGTVTHCTYSTPCTTAKSGYIAGYTNPAPSTSGLSYTISAVSGATSYAWIVPTGWTITAGQGTTSITVTSGTAQGVIAVTVTKSCGSATTSKRVTPTSGSAPAKPGTITSPPSTICSGGTGYSYSISPVAGATSYVWSVPTGSTINYGQGSTTITVTLGTTSGNISVTAVNASGSSAANTVAVSPSSAPAAPGSITGNATACQNASYSYSISSVSGATDYVWTFPSGWSVNNPNNTTSVTGTIGSGSGNITVAASNTCGTSSATTKAVAVSTGNPGSPTIGGAASPCAGTSGNIYTATASGATNYTWAVPSGYTFTTNTAKDTMYLTTGGVGNNGNISVTPSNTCGNGSTNTKYITPVAGPTATAGSPQTICAGQTVSIGTTFVSGHTYSWSSSPAGFSSTASNPSVSPTTTTTYTMVETLTSSGCSKSTSVTITIAASPTATVIASRSTCAGEVISIGGTTVSGNTYAWTSNPAGFTSTIANPSVTASATTTYYLTETKSASGCTKSNNFTLTVNARPDANAGSARSICSGASTSLGATAVSGNTYAWTSNPAGFTSTVANPSVSPTVNTTYSLTETVTATGCQKINTVVVTVNALPSANAGNASSVCSGSSTSLGATAVSGNTYSWTSNPAGFTSTVANPSVSPTASTTYSLTETVTATGCQKTNTVVVTVNALPSANAGSSSSICSGASTSLGATAVSGNTYAWTSNPAGFTSTAANPFVSPTATTIYTLTETVNATGCNKSNNVTKTVNSLPAAATGNAKTICNGASTSIGATTVSGSTYSWTSLPAGFSSTSAYPSVSPIVNTTYSLTETVTATGCAKTNSVAVTVTQVTTANAGSNQSLGCVTTATLAGNTPSNGTGAWSRISGKGVISSPSNPASGITGMSAGLSTFRWTITNGTCSNYSNVNIRIDCASSYTVAAITNKDSLYNGYAMATPTDPDSTITSAVIATGSLPAGVSMSSTTGIFSVTNKNLLVAGSYPLTVTTTDAKGGVSTPSVTLVITADNEAIYTARQSRNFDTYKNGDTLATVTDANGAIISAIRKSGTLPAGTSLNANTGVITITNLAVLVPGSKLLTIGTTDATGGLSNPTVTVVVGPDKEAYYSPAVGKNVDAYRNNQLLITFSDSDGIITSATLSSGTLPPGLSLNATDGKIKVCDSTKLRPGSYNFYVTTHDATGGITVNQVGIIFVADIEALYSQQATKPSRSNYSNGEILAAPDDSNGVVVSAILISGTLPPGTNLDPETGIITVSNKDILVNGEYPLSILTTDVKGGTTINTLTISFLNPLPVSLIDFSAALAGNAVKLNWHTASELNNNHFDIERSEDGVKFSKLDEVAGHGTTQLRQSYEWEDKLNVSLTVSILYYRLRQVDNNGAFEYLPIRKVMMNRQVEALKVWYNKSAERMVVTLNGKEDGEANVAVSDMNGKLVVSQSMHISKGQMQFELNMSGLKSGVYYFSLEFSGEQTTAKMLKY